MVLSYSAAAILLTTLITVSTSTGDVSDAYPSPYTTATTSCGLDDGSLSPIRREVYDDGRIIDITHPYLPDTPAFRTKDGVEPLLGLLRSMKNGSLSNSSQMKMSVHTGTHVDAPGHVFDHYFDAGFDVDTLDLHVLNGPGLLVDVPRDKNITAEVMKSLNIAKGARRVLFRTFNTDRRLMWKKEFDSSYTGFTMDGAQWLKDNTDIKLVGTDYLSVAVYDESYPSHHVLLESRVTNICLPNDHGIK